jgi:mRNA interferase RelE/StbE
MVVNISNAFGKDMRGIHPNYHRKVAQIIEEMKDSNDIRQIQNLEPCEGAPNAYRIRMGDYRIGIYIVNDVIQVKRIGKRGDFYNYFP